MILLEKQMVQALRQQFTLVRSSVFLSFLKEKRNCARGNTSVRYFAQHSNQGEIFLGVGAKKWTLINLYFNCKFGEKRDRNRRVTDHISSQDGD